MSRTLYHFLAAMTRLTVRSGRSKDIEIIVLRHQLAMLNRQINQPQLADNDRPYSAPSLKPSPVPRAQADL